MAEKSSRLLIDALMRAALEPDGTLLLSNKVEEGLFPPTVLAKKLADRCKEEGLLQVVRQDHAGKKPRELAVITPKGKELLQQNSDPKQLLEDCVRALERREEQIDQLVRQVLALQHSMVSIQELLASIVPDLAKKRPAPEVTKVAEPPTKPTLAERILYHLAHWQKPGEAHRDCPLPQLFQAIGQGNTLGQFHDELRLLHKEKKLYLHPWTGPLYLLPMPAFALLVGHEIAYYASLANVEGLTPHRGEV